MMCAAAALAGCTSDPAPAPTTAASAPIPAALSVSAAVTTRTPGLEGAKALAMVAVNSTAAGDWGRVWDVWHPDIQKTMSRAEWVRFRTLCPVLTGIAGTIVDAHAGDKPDSAVVQINRGGAVFAIEAVWIGKEWRQTFDEATQAEYKLGADKLAAKRRQEYACVTK